MTRFVSTGTRRLIPSPHDKNTVYLAGSSVFKSTDFGKNWTAISDDLTTGNKERLKDAGGPVFTENTSAEYFETIISLAESPIKKDLLWAGTDDGNLQITNDGGRILDKHRQKYTKCSAGFFRLAYRTFAG